MTDAYIRRGPSVFARCVTYCPTCDRRRRFSGGVQAWYDTIWTCCGCGDSWSREGRMPRPFARGWRERAIAGAKRDWARGVTHREAVRRALA